MKLAMCYTVFNGEELLIQSVNNHIELVDEIIICFQQTSNKNNSNPGLLSILAQLSGKEKINFVEFHPNFNINSKENERNKHNLMIETARKSGSTHFILAACDHFYKSEEFKKGKKIIENMNYDMIFTPMFTYYKRFTWQITPIEDYYMPFICKLYDNTRIAKISNFPVRVDPSVQINTFDDYYVCGEDEIMLHHYSMIRKDIINKFKNAASSMRWSKEMVDRFISEYENANLESKISYFQGRGFKEVENYFNLRY